MAGIRRSRIHHRLLDHRPQILVVVVVVVAAAAVVAVAVE